MTEPTREQRRAEVCKRIRADLRKRIADLKSELAALEREADRLAEIARPGSVSRDRRVLAQISEGRKREHERKLGEWFLLLPDFLALYPEEQNASAPADVLENLWREIGGDTNWRGGGVRKHTVGRLFANVVESLGHYLDGCREPGPVHEFLLEHCHASDHALRLLRAGELPEGGAE